MAGTIHLVRHGHHGLLDRVLCGRMPGIELDEFGRCQIAACAELISPVPTVVQSSPALRARQSASILGARFRVPVETAAAMDEIDLGDWTGAPFSELQRDPRWRDWNARRAIATPPYGESMYDLQQRVVAHLEQLAGDPAHDTVVVVSHAEPIRAALLHYLGIPLDDFLRVEVAPASISSLVRVDGALRVSQDHQKVPA